MTKGELVGLVNRVFVLWNQQVPVVSQKEVYEAWWGMLWDLEFVAVEGAVTALSVLDGFMPRPGALRRKVIDDSGVVLAPSPIEAWNLLRAVTDRVNSGTFEPVVWHPAVGETVRRIGTNLHTNGDREQFIKLYETIVNKWQQNLYTPGTPQ